MPVPTTQEMIDAIDSAIYALMTGGAVKSYSLEGRALDRYSLTELRSLQRDYRQRLALEQGGALTNYASFADPRRSGADDQ